MTFAAVFPALIQKAERKGRSRDEVLQVTTWLTGYSHEDIIRHLEGTISYGDFFLQAPMPHPNRHLIKGSVCGVRIENITDNLMREIRYLDKLVDELAKGKALEKILR